MSAACLSRSHCANFFDSQSIVSRLRVQALANVVHATGGEDRTPYAPQTHFSRARDTSSTHTRWLMARMS